MLEATLKLLLCDLSRIMRTGHASMYAYQPSKSLSLSISVHRVSTIVIQGAARTGETPATSIWQQRFVQFARPEF